MSRCETRRTGHAIAALLLAAAVATPGATPARAAETPSGRELTAAYNASAHDLFAAFTAKPGNIVFSPYSVGTAMAMVLSGARGDTASEMGRVLRHTLSREAIGAANAGVLATLAGYDRSKAPPSCPHPMRFNGRDCEMAVGARGSCTAGVQDGRRCMAPARRQATATFRSASALMLLTGTGAVVAEGYAKLLADKYRAQVFRGADLDEINGWVKRQTADKIDRILDQVDPEAPAVILNAVYFKAAWQVPFAKSATADGDFKVAPAATVTVPMMHQLGRYDLIERPGYRAVRLPYSVDALSMVVALPDEVGGADKLAGALDGPTLAALFRDLAESKNVDLALPRFKTSFRAQLGETFQHAGMGRAFDPNRADFSGMTGHALAQAPFAVSDVVHRAVIEVTEEGTEAAAATAVAMTRASVPDHVEPFVVDRPFLFYIVDQATGAILFQGRISDPRAP